MKQKASIITAVVAVIIFMAGVFYLSSKFESFASSMDEKIELVEEESKIEDEILHTRIDSLSVELTEARERLEKAEGQIRSNSGRISQSQRDIVSERERVRLLELEIERIKVEEVEEKEEKVKKKDSKDSGEFEFPDIDAIIDDAMGPLNKILEAF